MVLEDQLLILVPGSALIACLVFVLTITKVSQLQAVTVLSLVSAILAVLLQQPAETFGRLAAMAATDLPPHHAARPLHLPSRQAVPAPLSTEWLNGSRVKTRRIVQTFPPEVHNLTTADSVPCKDQREDCQLRAASGECSINDLRKADQKMHKHVAMLLLQCPVSCGSCHIVRGNEIQPVGANGEQLKCHDKHVDCGMWAQQGECSANPSYMVTSCAKACRTCYMLDYKTRCQRLPRHNIPAVENGDIDLMFGRLVAGRTDATSPFHKYDIKVLSEPPDGPWLVQIDNLLPEDDCEAFTNHTYTDMQVSADAGAVQPDGALAPIKSHARTSYNSWCKGACAAMPAARRLAAAIESITGVEEANSEFLQVLRYRESQYYRHHHDYITSNAGMPCGVRIYTMLLYLNDVEEGGETQFDTLNITVKPKKGRAIIWPSVLNDAVTQKDPRTDHQALPVTRGTKYAINAWLHLYNFRHYYNFACTG